MAEPKKQKNPPETVHGYSLFRRPGLYYAKYLPETNEYSVRIDGEFLIYPADLFGEEFIAVTPATATRTERLEA